MPFTTGDFVLGLEGLALLRGGPHASDATLAARRHELTAVLDALDSPELRGDFIGAAVDVRPGYASWSESYDEQPNPLIAVETAAVEHVLASWPSRQRVLDAACGTGRHCVTLDRLGHDVTGLDETTAMLGHATRNAPDARLVEGDLERLPFPDAGFDGAVCTLALSHLTDPAGAVGELARVVHPGGRVLISDLHPSMVLLGGQAAFRTPDGTPQYVPSYLQLPGTMLRAFATAGLVVGACHEPGWTLETASASFPGLSPALYAEAIEGLPLAVVWDLTRGA